MASKDKEESVLNSWDTPVDSVIRLCVEQHYHDDDSTTWPTFGMRVVPETHPSSLLTPENESDQAFPQSTWSRNSSSAYSMGLEALDVRSPLARSSITRSRDRATSDPLPGIRESSSSEITTLEDSGGLPSEESDPIFVPQPPPTFEKTGNILSQPPGINIVRYSPAGSSCIVGPPSIPLHFVDTSSGSEVTEKKKTVYLPWFRISVALILPLCFLAYLEWAAASHLPWDGQHGRNYQLTTLIPLLLGTSLFIAVSSLASLTTIRYRIMLKVLPVPSLFVPIYLFLVRGSNARDLVWSVETWVLWFTIVYLILLVAVLGVVASSLTRQMSLLEDSTASSTAPRYSGRFGYRYLLPLEVILTAAIFVDLYTTIHISPLMSTLNLQCCLIGRILLRDLSRSDSVRGSSAILPAFYLFSTFIDHSALVLLSWASFAMFRQENIYYDLRGSSVMMISSIATSIPMGSTTIATIACAFWNARQEKQESEKEVERRTSQFQAGREYRPSWMWMDDRAYMQA